MSQYDISSADGPYGVDDNDNTTPSTYDDDNQQSNNGNTFQNVAIIGVLTVIISLVVAGIVYLLTVNNNKIAKQKEVAAKRAISLRQQAVQLSKQPSAKVSAAKDALLFNQTTPTVDANGDLITATTTTNPIDAFNASLEQLFLTNDDDNNNSDEQGHAPTEPDVGPGVDADSTAIARWRTSGLCPPGKIIKKITLADQQTTKIHCYQPCDPGMDSQIIDPNSTDKPSETGDPNAITWGSGEIWTPGEKVPDGAEQPSIDPYYVCRTRCNARTSVNDPVETSTYCARQTHNRMTREDIGFGPDIVICPWITEVNNGAEGRPKDCVVSQTGKGGGNYTCWKGMTQPYGEGRFESGDQWKDASSTCIYDMGKKTYSGREPVACGRNYELIPVSRSAYWSAVSQHDDGRLIWKDIANTPLEKARSKMVGRRCVKQCPAGMRQVGNPEAMMCAAACPAGTTANPVEPSQCIKDGSTQIILASDLQAIDAKIPA